MNSSFSTALDSAQMMLSDVLDILPLLHTVGIEFTVLREKGLPVGLIINLQYLLAEKAGGSTEEKPQIFKKNTNNGRIP